MGFSPFIFCGDSGQEDARIYREVVRRHPGRIKAIYIRDVQVPERAALVGSIIEELGREDVPMLLAADYATAATHAAGLGLMVYNSPRRAKTKKARHLAGPFLSRLGAAPISPP